MKAKNPLCWFSSSKERLCATLAMCSLVVLMILPIPFRMYRNHLISEQNSEFSRFFGSDFPRGGMRTQEIRATVITKLIEVRDLRDTAQSKKEMTTKDLAQMPRKTVDDILAYTYKTGQLKFIEQDIVTWSDMFDRMCMLAYKAGYRVEVEALGWKPPQHGLPTRHA